HPTESLSSGRPGRCFDPILDVNADLSLGAEPVFHMLCRPMLCAARNLNLGPGPRQVQSLDRTAADNNGGPLFYILSRDYSGQSEQRQDDCGYACDPDEFTGQYCSPWVRD